MRRPGLDGLPSESIFDYRKHYGRTFHAERDNLQYWSANDQRQSEAIDILHHTVTLFQDGKLYQVLLERGNFKVRCAPIGGLEAPWADAGRPGEESPRCRLRGRLVPPTTLRGATAGRHA